MQPTAPQPLDGLPRPQPVTGLILTGGGARAAYQVGVLAALAQLRRDAGVTQGNPFPIISGTSAGAISASALACHADDFDGAVDGLLHLWQGLHVEDIYRADAFEAVKSGARWVSMLSLGWAIARWTRSRPRSLLDNEPLRQLLMRYLDMGRVESMLAGGHLRALALTGSSYSSGQHVTFFQTHHHVVPWLREQRMAVQTRLDLGHLMASSAIPFIFPAEPLDFEGDVEWFGDGSMRQSAPISPAVHLGADRVLVIGAGRMKEPEGRRRLEVGSHPSMAQIAGHALSNIFLDALSVDVERLRRINRTLALLPREARSATALRPIELLVIAPSRRLDDLAGEHQASLPKSVRAMLRAFGVSGRGKKTSGSALVSYLLFEPSFIGELVNLGMSDTLAKRAEVQRFFGWPARAPQIDPASLRRGRSAGFAASAPDSLR
ncbi:patatin-like phospholipase family protein [Roseateles cellulosilyticus]|uniref:Patatin-like phospholipase family protein n=1 Tax=Pelomonas cellulosilytica TaxID=2906762 RepID=A0ABS8XQS4_9BURK|nr:patatin-like phospholipase family protein [Pelomonas sp. P8]MCE4555099.1 patatin-like phospholipase family protein [Pelomonas sp. P8]